MQAVTAVFSEPAWTTVAPRVVLCALLGVALSSLPSLAQAQSTLYERLGGYDAIAGFVDLAFPRVSTHPELAHFFRGHSTDSQLRQRQLIVDALCHATGGPCIYIGRPMKPVHDGLGISAEHWQVFLGIITTAIEERQFPEAEKKAFLAIFERFRPEVVESP